MENNKNKNQIKYYNYLEKVIISITVKKVQK